MTSVDWSARPDQIEGLALREVGVRTTFVEAGHTDRSVASPEICSHTRAFLQRTQDGSRLDQ
jgi:hypothetical protein